MGNGPQVLDETNPDDDGFDHVRRNSAFRVAAVLVCGIGLATACITLVRVSQDRPAGRSEARAPQVARATAPPARPAAAGAAASTTSSPAGAAAAPTIPVATPSPPRPPQGAAEGAPETTASVSLPASVNRPAPAAAPTPQAEKPHSTAALDPQADAPAAAAPSRGPDSVSTPKAPRRAQAGSALASRDLSGQFREATAPRGSGPGVRAYTFATDGGEIDARGVRRVAVGVR